MSRLATWATGFSWPEAPRWHRGALWISDVHNFRIAQVQDGQNAKTVLDVAERPAGMDFTSGGDLLYATSLAARLYRWSGGAQPELLFDLGDGLNGNFNDMIVGPDGWAWVGETGFAFGLDEPVNRGRIHGFHPDHGCRVVAEDVFFPNGMIVAGNRLILCETFGKQLTSFRIGQNGALEDRRVLAKLPGHPDGLCQDRLGRLWVPLLFEERFLCLSADGDHLFQIDVPGQMAIACAADRERLFLCAATLKTLPDGPPERHGSVFSLPLAETEQPAVASSQLASEPPLGR